jgi:hypothetical protein
MTKKKTSATTNGIFSVHFISFQLILSCSLAALVLRLTAEDGGSTGKTFRSFLDLTITMPLINSIRVMTYYWLYALWPLEFESGGR